ncbi:hypothetical protein P7K49_002371, partial [Saguinus oedipus]
MQGQRLHSTAATTRTRANAGTEAAQHCSHHQDQGKHRDSSVATRTRVPGFHLGMYRGPKDEAL